jgi:hypothetical protein
VPVIELKPRFDDSTTLKDALLDEWKENPSAGATPTTDPPTIYEEKNGSGQIVHVYVVWDKWADLAQGHRSRIITDAFWERYPADAGALTIAMGLTKNEAKTLGIG